MKRSGMRVRGQRVRTSVPHQCDRKALENKRARQGADTDLPPVLWKPAHPGGWKTGPLSSYTPPSQSGGDATQKPSRPSTQQHVAPDSSSRLRAMTAWQFWKGSLWPIASVSRWRLNWD